MVQVGLDDWYVRYELAVALGQSVDEIREAKRLFVSEVSLDAPVERHDNRAATFGDRVSINDGSDIESRADNALQREFILKLFKTYLTPRERRILSLYYGLDEGSEPITLEGIGVMLGITRERVRQIRERAFEKLRRSPDIQQLQGFWMAA